MTRILLIRMSSMGDLIHTLPAVTDLFVHFPEIKLGWLSEEAYAEIPRLHPQVSHVTPVALRRWRHTLWHVATRREWQACCGQINSQDYDMVLDAQGLLKSAWMAYQVKGVARVGFDWHSVREPIASFFYHKTWAVSRELDAVSRNRLLFGRAFGYEPDLSVVNFGIRTPEKLDWVPKNPYVVCLTATSRANKEWPIAHWQQFIEWLIHEQNRFVILPWGNEKERARCLRLAAAYPEVLVAPRLNLNAAAALLGHAVAVVGVDTGLTHLANALNVPLLALYTDTNPARTGVQESFCARNLGGIAQIPTVDEVCQLLIQVCSV